MKIQAHILDAFSGETLLIRTIGTKEVTTILWLHDTINPYARGDVVVPDNVKGFIEFEISDERARKMGLVHEI